MQRKAFTLIEVMVVLSILAIIAILAYNFFGSTMKEATVTTNATRIMKDMAAIAGAVLEYERRTGNKVAGQLASTWDYVDEAGPVGIFEEVGLKATPSVTDLYSTGWGGMLTKYLIHAGYDFDADGNKDVHITLYFTDSGDTCKKFNELYTDVGFADIGNVNDAMPGGTAACVGTTASKFIIYPVYY